MLGEPSAKQLVEAAAGFLEKTAAPQLSGHAAFHARVAINVLQTVARELELGPAASAAEHARLVSLLGKDGELDNLRRCLCAQIRTGAFNADTPELLDHLLATAADRVAIEQPNYGSLKRARA
jgi:hypothetical protein